MTTPGLGEWVAEELIGVGVPVGVNAVTGMVRPADPEDLQLGVNHRLLRAGEVYSPKFRRPAEAPEAVKATLWSDPQAVLQFWTMFRELQRKVYDTAASKGFHDDDAPKGTYERGLQFSRNMMTAVGELAEGHDWFQRGRGIDEWWEGPDGKPDGVPIEIADAIIRLLDTCEAHQIDLVGALVTKMQFNAGRERMHGKQF